MWLRSRNKIAKIDDDASDLACFSVDLLNQLERTFLPEFSEYGSRDYIFPISIFVSTVDIFYDFSSKRVPTASRHHLDKILRIQDD